VKAPDFLRGMPRRSVRSPLLCPACTGGIFKEAFIRGADCIVTTCPMCQMNLDLYQKDILRNYSLEHNLPVFYLTELVGLALGHTTYDLGLDKHFVQGKETVEETLEYAQQ